MTTEPQSRFSFPIPDQKHRTIMHRILHLMMDGKRRSKKEIREALGLDEDTEVGARIRDLRRAKHGAWAFNDSRAEGPDDDGVFRHVLRGAPKEKP